MLPDWRGGSPGLLAPLGYGLEEGFLDIPLDGLLAVFDPREAEGSILPDVWAGHDMTLINSPTISQDDAIITYNGTNQWARIVAGSAGWSLVEDVTMCMVVRPAAVTGERHIVGRASGSGTQDSYTMRIRSTARYQATFNPETMSLFGVGSTDNNAVVGEMALLVASFRGGLQRLVKNGTLVQQLTLAAGDILENTANLQFSIGARNIIPSAFWSGEIGIVSIYNRAFVPDDEAQYREAMKSLSAYADLP